MKKIASLVVMALMLGCIPANATIGYIYQNASEPGGGYADFAVTKTGVTKCTSFFYIVGIGDCAVGTAAKKGGIKNLAYWDVQKKNIVGFQRITIKAYGN